MVTPAFFQNKLRPTQSAEVISDEQVEREQEEAAAAKAELQQKANALKEELSDFTLSISRKAGPDGQLFGGIGQKVIADELKKQKIGDLFGKRGVKITSLMDGEGKKMRGDIKHTGEFRARLALTKDIDAQLSIAVKAET